MKNIPSQKELNKSFLHFAVLFILFTVLYAPIFKALFHDWTFIGDYYHSDNSHGMLVPFISIYLLWRIWDKIPWQDIESSNTGLAILSVSLATYLIGYAGGIFVIPRFAMLGTLYGLVLYNFGRKIFSVLLFPLLFLIFMIPVPYSVISLVSLPLQTMVTQVSAFIIRDVFSLPVFREGNMLYFTKTSLEVAEACSGIRSLMTFMMLGTFFAYISEGTFQRKIIFCIMAPPLAILTNLLRVTGTGVLAHYFGKVVAKGFLHEFSGFAVLLFGIFLMLALWKLLNSSGKGLKRSSLDKQTDSRD